MDAHRRAVGIANPDAVAFRKRVRIAAAIADPARELLEVVVVRAEAQVLQPLRFPVAVHDAPAVRVARRAELEARTFAADVEAERLVKARGFGEIRHAECEAIERMDAEHIAAARKSGLWRGGSGHLV